MVPPFLYDHTKSALPSTTLPLNPSWSTEKGSIVQSIKNSTSNQDSIAPDKRVIKINVLPICANMLWHSLEAPH